MILCICQSNFESLLAEEIAAAGHVVGEKGPGWLLAEAPFLEDWAFPQGILDQPVEITGESVNSLAQAIATYFMEGLRGDRIDAPWPCVFAGPAEIVGLGRRISAVEGAFAEAMKKETEPCGETCGAAYSKGSRRLPWPLRLLHGFQEGVCFPEFVSQRTAPDGRRRSGTVS